MAKSLAFLLLPVFAAISVHGAPLCSDLWTADQPKAQLELLAIRPLSQDLRDFEKRTFRSVYTQDRLLEIASLVLSVPAAETLSLFENNRGLVSDREMLVKLSNHRDPFVGLNPKSPARQVADLFGPASLKVDVISVLARVPGSADGAPLQLSAQLREQLQQRLLQLHQKISAAHDQTDLLIAEIAFFTRDLYALEPAEQKSLLAFHLAEVLLMHLDLPPPRDGGFLPELAAKPAAEAPAILQHSMAATQALLKDFALRNQMGLPLALSPWIHLNRPLPSVNIVKKKQGQSKVYGEKTFQPEAEQWLAFVTTKLKQQPVLKWQLAKKPQDFLDEQIKDYSAFVQKTTVEFEHDKEGLRDIGLRFADLDYLVTSNVPLSRDPELYQKFLKKWYRPEIIWRGHGFKDRALSEDEILNLFSKYNLQLASNPVITESWRGVDIFQAGFKGELQYNDSLLTGDVYRFADDHHRMGPLYQQSYGFSTSKSFEVGRSFAMGAMNVAEYGHQDEAQDLLKTRLNVGIWRAQHYVEMGRLKPINPDFSYEYGRQQEVMGIGIADPESVAIIKEINPDKRTLRTFARNPQRPSEILVISGDYDLNEPVPEDRLQKRVSLLPISLNPPVNGPSQAPAHVSLWQRLANLLHRN